MATGLWKEKGVPHKGWSCVGVTDLRDDDPEAELVMCEMCRVQEIRYVHRMTHPGWADELDVGCICAEKMEEDYTAARRREAPLRSRAARRAKWVGRGWRQSRQGHDYRNSFGYRVTLRPVEHTGCKGWGGTIACMATGEVTRSTKVHPTADRAKLAAFDTIELWRSKRTQHAD
jgi:hypothetical protein